MTIRSRLILLANDHKVIQKGVVWYLARKDRKAGEAEFDKVVGSGLGTLRRRDGSVVAAPVSRPNHATASPTIAIPLDRSE